VNTLSVSLSYLSLSVSLSLGFNNYHNFGVWVGAFLDSEKKITTKKTILGTQISSKKRSLKRKERNGETQKMKYCAFCTT
jgi:hypothetical protein